jgi:hypothetical protein
MYSHISTAIQQLLVTVNGKQCFAFREKKEAEENWEMYDKLTAAV